MYLLSFFNVAEKIDTVTYYECHRYCHIMFFVGLCSACMSECVVVFQLLPGSKSTQMITFRLTNSCIVTIRTSGTEPKIKYYTEFCSRPEMG